MQTGPAPATGARVDVCGVPTYYEVHGTGPPLLLLHGAFCTVETFADQIPALAEEFRVVVPERRGHGRTPDIGDAYSYDLLTDDTIAFMDATRIDKADVVGYSDGANVALLTAMRHPQRVRRLVLISCHLDRDALGAAFADQLAGLTPAFLSPGLVRLYHAHSPDGPEHFGVVFDKVKRMWMGKGTVAADVLGAVGIETLVMAADRDGVDVRETTRLFAALPRAQLCIVPGTTHELIRERPGLVNRVVLDFLRH